MISKKSIKSVLFVLLFALPAICAPFARRDQNIQTHSPKTGADWGFLEDFKASQYYLSPEASPWLNDQAFFTFKMDKDGNYTISITSAPAYFASTSDKEEDVSFDQPSGSSAWYFAYTELRDVFNGQYTLKLRTSYDFGKTWVISTIATWNAVGETMIDIMYYLRRSAIAVRPETGVFTAFTWVNGTSLTFINSTDNGTTWSSPRKILDIADIGFAKTWIDVPHIDTGILPNGTIVVICDANNTAMPQLTPVVYLESYDNGTTWSSTPLNVTCVKTPKANNARIQVDASGNKYWLMWRAINGTVYNNRWAEFNSSQDLNNATTAVKNVSISMSGNYDFIRDMNGRFRVFEIRYQTPISNNTQWTCTGFISGWTQKQILPRIEDLHQLGYGMTDFSMAYDGKTEHYFYAGEAGGGSTSMTGLYHYTLESNRTFWEKKGNFTAGNLVQESWNGKAQGIYAINGSRVKVNFLGQNNSCTPIQLGSSLYINIDNDDPNFNQYEQGKYYFNPLSQDLSFNDLNWTVAPSESVTYKLDVFQNQSQASPPRMLTSNNFDEASGSFKIFLSTTGQLYIAYVTIKEGVQELNFIRSSNGGVTWTSPTTILTSSGYVGEIACAGYSDIVVVIVTYSTGASTATHLFRSYDQGDSFESPISLTEPLFPANYRNVESCAFSTNGTLFTGYLIPAFYKFAPYSLGEFHVMRSDDFGLTWSESQMWYLDPGYNVTQVQPAFLADPNNNLIHVCLPQTNNSLDAIHEEQYKVANFTFSTLEMSTEIWGPLRSTGNFPIGIYFIQPQFVLWQENLTAPTTLKVFFLRNFTTTPVVDVIYNEIDSFDLGDSWNLPHASVLDNMTMIAAEVGAWYYLDSKSDGNDNELLLTCDSRKVRTQEGSLPPAQVSEIRYDGKRDDESDLPPGNYTYRLMLVDNAGNRQNKTGWFYIDYDAPSMSVGPNLNWSALATPRFDMNVSIQVTDEVGFGVWLHYQKNTNPWQNFLMTPAGGEGSTIFYAVIPGDLSTTSVKYFVTARDAAGNEALRNNGGMDYEFHMPSFMWTAMGLFNSTVEYFSNQNYEFNLTITKDIQFVNQVIFRYTFDGDTWNDQSLVASGNLYSGSLQNLPGDLKTLQYQLIVIDAFSNEVVLLSTQQISFQPEIPSLVFSDMELILVLIASLMIGITVALGYLKLKHASHRVVSQQILTPNEGTRAIKEQEFGEREENGKKTEKNKENVISINVTPTQRPRSPFTYVFLVVFVLSILVLAGGLQLTNLSPVWAVVTLVASLLLGVFGFMILSSRDIAENIYSEKIRFSNVLLEVLQVGILLWVIINVLQVGYMIPWFRYYLIDSTYDLFGLLIPKLYVSVIGVFFTSLVVVLISTYWELRNTVQNIQRQKKDSALSGIALLYIKDEHSNRLITNMGIKTVIFLVTVLVTVISTTDLLTYENIIALVEVLGPFAIGSLLVLMIQPALTKRREKALKHFQLPFVEAEKVCAKCGTKIFISSRYCKVCGTQQVFEQVVGQYNTRCALCGGLIAKESTFCTSCGTKMQLLKVQ